MMRSSADGRRWEPSVSLSDVWDRHDRKGAVPAEFVTVPDANDPPDLEFYSGNGFWYHDRAYMTVLNYAASPLAPRKHGPHLDNEWWTSRDGLRWERPARGVNALEVFPQIPRLEIPSADRQRLDPVSTRPIAARPARGPHQLRQRPGQRRVLDKAVPHAGGGLAVERRTARARTPVRQGSGLRAGRGAGRARDDHPRIRGGEVRHPQRRPQRHPTAMGRGLRTPARRTDRPAQVLPPQRQHLCRHGPDRPVKHDILSHSA